MTSRCAPPAPNRPRVDWWNRDSTPGSPTRRQRVSLLRWTHSPMRSFSRPPGRYRPLSPSVRELVPQGGCMAKLLLVGLAVVFGYIFAFRDARQHSDHILGHAIDKL